MGVYVCVSKGFDFHIPHETLPPNTLESRTKNKRKRTKAFAERKEKKSTCATKQNGKFIFKMIGVAEKSF